MAELLLSRDCKNWMKNLLFSNFARVIDTLLHTKQFTRNTVIAFCVTIFVYIFQHIYMFVYWFLNRTQS